MKLNCFFFVLVFLVYMPKANGQAKFVHPGAEELDKAIKAGIDPYFVESTDTFSTQGPNCIVRHLTQDKNGNLWLASWQGIIRYDGKTFTNHTLKDKLIHFHVFYTFEDSKGNMWFSLVRGGVYKYDGKTFAYFSTKDGLGDNTTQSIIEDKGGNIWFATENGATCYNGKTFTNFTTKHGLCNNDVRSMMCDHNGKIWIGTKMGISIYDGNTFTDFKYKNEEVFKQVASLFEDKDGNIWIGSNTGFMVYNRKEFSEPLRDHFVMYLNQDKNGSVWTAINLQNSKGEFEGFSLCSYDPKNIFEKNGKIFTKAKPPYDPNNFAIFGILCDKEGKVWFGSAKGICKFDPTMMNNVCVQGVCKHEGSAVKAMREHTDEQAKAFTIFN